MSFYGKTYSYKNKTIGVYRDPISKVYMAGFFKKDAGTYRRVINGRTKRPDEMQRKLDEFAMFNRLQEAQS